jgi:hypothetical protein
MEASKFYSLLGYRSVILDGTSYVRGTGWDRHVTHPDDAISDPTRLAGSAAAPAAAAASGPLSGNAPCPCGSSMKYKHCHGKMVDACRYTSRLCSTAAPMNEANSGCGSNGRDFSSGWNCTPMNQGWSVNSMISGKMPSGYMPQNRMPRCSSRSL